MENIKSIDLYKHQIEGVFDCTCACFFIAEKTRDEAFIGNLAKKLIGEGCRRFTFFGKHRLLWENIFDDVDIELNPHCGYEDVSVTMTDKYIETFADGIIGEFKPNVYLFYDDEKRQKEVLELVEKEQSQADDTKRYMLNYEGTKEMFYRICKEFEKDYPYFEKDKLLVDPLDNELIQCYTKGDKKATIIFERVFDEWIAGYANFDLEKFSKKCNDILL